MECVARLSTKSYVLAVNRFCRSDLLLWERSLIANALALVGAITDREWFAVGAICNRELTYKLSTNLNPSSTRSNIFPGSTFTLLSRSFRLMVTTCEMFTTDALASPESDLLTRTFPGACARARFEVIVATRMVAILLLLNELA